MTLYSIYASSNYLYYNIIKITLPILNAFKLKKTTTNRKDPGVLAKYHTIYIRYKSAVKKYHARQETSLLK